MGRERPGMKEERAFQSPSQRGGGAAFIPMSLSRPSPSGFNPLRKGEAAPPWSRTNVYVDNSVFQSPSRRGGGAAEE